MVKMKRCKHLNCDLIEEYRTSSVHFIRDGRVEGHQNESQAGEYTGKLQIECQDCGKTFTYSDLTSAPVWVKAFRALVVND